MRRVKFEGGGGKCVCAVVEFSSYVGIHLFRMKKGNFFGVIFLLRVCRGLEGVACFVRISIGISSFYFPSVG